MLETTNSPRAGQADAAPSSSIFGSHAVALRRAGLAVLPAHGKSPMRKGFSTMKTAPSVATVEKWAERTPDADIVVVPGLSRTANGCEFVVLDADDMESSDFVERTFGTSDVRVKTRKGMHHWFELPGGTDLGKMHSLRSYGLNIDVKHGQAHAGIVVAPPSRHADQRDFQYELVGGADVQAFGDVRQIDLGKLYEITSSQVVAGRNDPFLNVTNTAPAARPPAAAGRMRDESRGQWLNDSLVPHAVWCDSIDEVLDKAFGLNQSLVGRGCQPLTADEVVARATEVWKHVESGKLVRMHKARQQVRVGGTEIETLIETKNGADAMLLLGKLRKEHGARVERGETFVLVSNAMAEAKTMGNWSSKRIRQARDTLLATGMLVLMCPARRNLAARYTLPTADGEITAGGRSSYIEERSVPSSYNTTRGNKRANPLPLTASGRKPSRVSATIAPEIEPEVPAKKTGSPSKNNAGTTTAGPQRRQNSATALPGNKQRNEQCSKRARSRKPRKSSVSRH